MNIFTINANLTQLIIINNGKIYYLLQFLNNDKLYK